MSLCFDILMSVDVLEELFDPKMISVMRVFYGKHDVDFNLKDVAKNSKVSMASTFRIVNRLVSVGIVKQTNVAGFKVYRLGDNERTRFLGQVVKREKQVLQFFVTWAKDIKELEAVILHGQETSERADVLLVGENINNAEVKSVCGEIKEKFSYVISPLVLLPDQFKDMVSMGLLPKKKTVLYRR